jgi:hypothetical protein
MFNKEINQYIPLRKQRDFFVRPPKFSGFILLPANVQQAALLATLGSGFLLCGSLN